MDAGLKISFLFVFSFWILTISCSKFSFAQQIETGAPFITNYSSNIYGSHDQNFAIAENSRGNMFFANNSSFLSFDGFNWENFYPNNEATFSLAIDKSGKFFFGGINEFGYYQPNQKNGALEYVCLSNLVKNECPKFDQVWFTFITTHGVYFISQQFIFRYHDKKLTVIKPYKGCLFHKAFQVENDVIVKMEGVGLVKLTNDSFELIAGTEKFAQLKIDFIMPFRNQEMIIGTREQGLYTCDNLLKTLPKPFIFNYFSCPASDIFKINSISCGILLANNLYCIGTKNKGIFLMNDKGEIIENIDKNKGLKGDKVWAVFQDSNKNIWAALDNGISMLEINLPIRFYSEKLGLSGNVAMCSKAFNKMYVATSLGCYYLNNRSGLFEQLALNAIECKILKSFKIGDHEKLFLGTENNLLMIDQNNQQKEIENIALITDIVQSKINPAVFWVCSADGLRKYKMDERINNFTLIQDYDFGYCSSIIEIDENTILLAAKNEKIEYVSFENERIFQLNVTPEIKQPELSEFNMIEIDNQAITGTSVGLFIFDKNARKFFPYTAIDGFANKTKSVANMQVDEHGNIWIASDSLSNATNLLSKNPGIAIKNKNKQFIWNGKVLKKISQENINFIYPSSLNTAWICSNSGLYKFLFSEKAAPKAAFFANIRKVYTKGDSIIFNGFKNITYTKSDATFPFNLNSIRFEFAANHFATREKVVFSTYLKNYDNNFTEWSSSNKKEYTNLHEGKYYFEVKAKDLNDNISQTDTFYFEILAPWYRTWWAYLLFACLIALAFYTALKLNTRRLKIINTGLEKTVARRTAEIVKQKNEIQFINLELTDSINYAQIIQQTTLPSEEKIKSCLPHSFVYYQPRDIVSGDFYWLNDVLKDKNKIFIAVADCTGHGVPGAFMSIMGNEKLNQSVKEMEIVSPASILSFINREIKLSLGQEKDAKGVKDGMEIVLCEIDWDKNLLTYSGANRPLWIFHVENDKVIHTIIKPTKTGIGGFTEMNQTYEEHVIPIENGKTFYLFTDGAVDQFGGERGRKLMSSGFKNLIESIFHLPLSEQKETIKNFYTTWQGNNFQVDDILIIAIKI